MACTYSLFKVLLFSSLCVIGSQAQNQYYYDSNNYPPSGVQPDGSPLQVPSPGLGNLPPNFGSTNANLGASPKLDISALKLSRNMDVYTNQLLSAESANLGEIARSDQDFKDWENEILAKFKLRQSYLSNYNQNDQQSDLRKFTRYLDSLQAEFRQRQTHIRTKQLYSERQAGFQHSVDLLSQALNKYRIAGQQYDALQAQQADLYNQCKQIGGAQYAPYDPNGTGQGSYGPYFDPNSGQGQLVNLISAGSGNPGVPGPYPPVQTIPPTLWQFPGPPPPSPSPAPQGTQCLGPLGNIDSTNRNNQPPYPDPSSKLGVLYDSLIDLCYDFSQDLNGLSGYNDQRLNYYKQQWNTLVTSYSRCVIRYNQVGQKAQSVQHRVKDLITFIQSAQGAAFAPPLPGDTNGGWQQSFTSSHISTFGPGSELSNGQLSTILGNN